MTTTMIRSAASLVADRCLLRGASLFTPRRRLWSVGRLDDLAGRLDRAAARARGGRSATFDERWQRALAPAPEDTVALAAEILYVHLLYPSSVGGARKRALLALTLERLSEPPALPGALDAALDGGAAPAGVAYTRRRLSQLAWLAAAGARWRGHRPADRRAALEDPRRAAAVLADVPVRGADPQRAALLHLLHADTFAPVTSVRVRAALLQTFATHVPAGEDDPDCALAAVRAALARVHGPGFSFFDPVVAACWQ